MTTLVVCGYIYTLGLILRIGASLRFNSIDIVWLTRDISVREKLFQSRVVCVFEYVYCFIALWLYCHRELPGLSR
jgi:hypothetical protein